MGVFTAECEDAEDLPDLLRHVADLIEQGYTSGDFPTWDIEDEEGE